MLPRPGEDTDIHAHYAQHWLEVGGLRVNFITSADGAVTQGGVSRGLQTAGDNAIFAALRDLADVVLVGAGTVRTEGYRPVRVTQRRAEMRARYGMPPQLTIAVISGSLDVGWLAEPVDSAPRTIVFTCAAADPARRVQLERFAEIVVSGESVVDLRQVRSALIERGLSRVLCEGGPHLFGSALQAGVVDELCLSIAPLVSGPGAGRIVSGDPLTAPYGLQLTGLLEEDSALFCRYAVPKSAR